ncbi:glycosyltransferase [Prolixibacteraceae bacterium JC049]|nr:glycosyltransferase [Prolixibacteraceae bacterium JC049]
MKGEVKKIHLAVTNDLVSDNRVHKIAASLLAMGFEVHLTGRKLRNSPELPKRFYNIKRMKLLFNKGPLFYAEYNLRLFFRLVFSDYDVMVANDLDTLGACAAVKQFRKIHLVYDSHELFTEVPELINRPKVQRFWSRIERWAMPKVDMAYTVCQSIAKFYQKKYGIHFRVVRNLPVPHQVAHTPEAFHIDNGEKKVILYQGALNVGRGLEKAISAMKWIDNAKLYIAGAGDIEEELKQLTQEKNLSEKVEFLRRFPVEELRYITQQADLGISLEEDRGLNYRYALPNKIFDYIQSEVPVLCSDLPEMQQVITNYKVGGIISHSSTEEELAKAMKEILVNGGHYRPALKQAAKELTWQNESKELEKIYSLFLLH